MNGSAYKRKNGTWAYQLYLGRDEAGKPIRHTESGFETKREADEEKARKLAEFRHNQAVKPSPRTLAEFMQEWFKEHAVRHCEGKMVERYESRPLLPASARTRAARRSECPNH